ncbi:MAG: hemerythrin domain-containing protein [Spirochaetota bacterium]
MEKIEVAAGIYWVEVPEAGLYILCGCPADSVKHLMKRGLIVSREKKGQAFETGPNALLLSDVLIQNGALANLAEFPVLQMFYRQGMLIPGHPGNTGVRPLLIGLEEQVRAQAEYIFRGNYGLASEEELEAAGVSRREAGEMMRLKLRFAFDRIQKTGELIDLRVIDRSTVELRNGVFIHRAGLNQYDIVYRGESVSVDLNLPPGQVYQPAYRMDFHAVRRGYFSVIHTGEGDGWDPTRPCMSSILVFQGRIFLIDAGPSIMHSLTTLGIGMNEVSGIFHTHVHDDHFAGLTALMRSDHRINYYAAPVVRASMFKKLAALLGIQEDEIERYFAVHHLEQERWNDIGGLEVRPVFSPHPVETTILFFRTLWEGGYRTYAHLADIASFKVLEDMVTEDPAKSGLTASFYRQVRDQYLTPADVKKIDIGGGLIHGSAADFAQDGSAKIYLSHTHRELRDDEKEIGSQAIFGMQDDLIAAHQDYLMQAAFYALQEYLPELPRHQAGLLLNSPVVSINPGIIFIKKGVIHPYVYLMLTGLVEYLEADREIRTLLPAGSLVGELAGLRQEPAGGTCRSLSYVRALRIPADVYFTVIRQGGLYERVCRLHRTREFLQRTWLFGEMMSDPVKNRIARVVSGSTLKSGEELCPEKQERLLLIRSGAAQIYCGGRPVERIGEGDFFGEEHALCGAGLRFTAKAVKKTELLAVPLESIRDVPIVQWKLLERLRRRIAVSVLPLAPTWSETYRTGSERRDRLHRDLFERMEKLGGLAASGGGEGLARELGLLVDRMKEHFRDEESLLEQEGAVGIERHRGAHRRFVRKVEARIKWVEKGQEPPQELLRFVETWLECHLLTEEKSGG